MHSKEAEGVGGVFVVKTVAIGIQNFRDLIEKKCFYVDKTDFIREWWESLSGRVTRRSRHCLPIT